MFRDCQALESMPDGMMIFNCRSNQFLLEELEIEGCHSIKCFLRGQLPLMLKVLNIQYCGKLESLPEGIVHHDNSTANFSHFEHLEIIGCPSLTSFPTGTLPTQLKTLKIYDCWQLEPLSDRMLCDNRSLEYIGIRFVEFLISFPECLHSLMHLTELDICNCSSLKSFPEVAVSLPNLRMLNIYSCVNLKSQPNQM